ncbi:STAS-like domain-containing protein [Adhaeribacter aquaticus]|uniref:STAS-like domain-containing protein n=1 Tax=Adhaeribacter aquaticus TaxID=299567 RepID=UPI00040D851C|nr:STAS-like domain-containing protein [Adhaeribacter aquaticus]
MQLTVSQIIGKSIAVLDIDGRKVYEQLEDAYKRGEKIVLSFKGLQHVTTAFLNAAIGRFLLSAPKPEEAKESLVIEDVDNDATKYKIEQVYELALNADLRAIKESARNQELGIHD